MGKSVEKTGKTVNEAIAAALSELGLSIDDVHVDVLNEGKAGLFGLLSGKPAKVRVSALDEDERVGQPGYTGQAPGGMPRADLPADDDDDDGAGYGQDGGAPANAARGGAAPGDAAGYDTYDEGFADGSAYDYDYDINQALSYLEVIFGGIKIPVGMEVEHTEDGFLISIESDDSGILIGHRGETLDAIQYLVNLYVNKGRQKFIRVTVDVENYKKKRETALIRVAGQTADKVVRLRRNFTLDAMNSYERRIVHSALQNHPRVETYSVGEDPNRKVVVTLKNRGGYSSRQ